MLFQSLLGLWLFVSSSNQNYCSGPKICELPGTLEWHDHQPGYWNLAEDLGKIDFAKGFTLPTISNLHHIYTHKNAISQSKLDPPLPIGILKLSNIGRYFGERPLQKYHCCWYGFRYRWCLEATGQSRIQALNWKLYSTHVRLTEAISKQQKVCKSEWKINQSQLMCSLEFRALIEGYSALITVSFRVSRSSSANINGEKIHQNCQWSKMVVTLKSLAKYQWK